jgi:hypothetical protein
LFGRRQSPRLTCRATAGPGDFSPSKTLPNHVAAILWARSPCPALGTAAGGPGGPPPQDGSLAARRVFARHWVRPGRMGDCSGSSTEALPWAPLWVGQEAHPHRTILLATGRASARHCVRPGRMGDCSGSSTEALPWAPLWVGQEAHPHRRVHWRRAEFLRVIGCAPAHGGLFRKQHRSPTLGTPVGGPGGPPPQEGSLAARRVFTRHWVRPRPMGAASRIAATMRPAA